MSMEPNEIELHIKSRAERWASKLVGASPARLLLLRRWLKRSMARDGRRFRATQRRSRALLEKHREQHRAERDSAASLLYMGLYQYMSSEEIGALAEDSSSCRICEGLATLVARDFGREYRTALLDQISRTDPVTKNKGELLELVTTTADEAGL